MNRDRLRNVEPPGPRGGPNWTSIERVTAQWQAEMIRDLLLDYNIPAIVQTSGTTIYTGFRPLFGDDWVAEVLVPVKCERAARALVDAMFSEQPDAEE